MDDPRNHKMTHLFEGLDKSRKTRKNEPPRRKRNGLLFLEKYFPFLGKTEMGSAWALKT
jgi:hypothetical protein